MAARQISLEELSGKGRLCWEKTLRTYCEFGVREEYEDLSERGKKAMLTALASSVMQTFAHETAPLLALHPKKTMRANRSLKCSMEDPLVEAMLQTVRDKTVLSNLTDEFLDHVRFKLLRSWGVPTSSDMLLLEHQGLDAWHDRRAEMKGKVTNVSVQKSSSNSSWNGLKPMSISELKLFETMKGMRMECKVVGEPHHTVGITTVLQDAYGSTVKCGIYNLKGVVDRQSAERVLPKGSTVIIAEPFLKIMMDGKRGVRVDNPNEIHIFLPGCRSLPPAGSIDAGKYQAARGGERKPERQQTTAKGLLEDYKVGQHVRVSGLTSKKGLGLNGRLGIITTQDENDLERVTVNIECDTGKAEAFKIQTCNLEIVAKTSLDDILETKTKANEAFSRGEVCVAVEGYDTVVRQLSSHKTSKAIAELTKCLCNRALCFLKQKKWNSAKDDAKMALELEPANAKAHYRLASAIFQEGEAASQEDMNLAAFHISVAIALLPKAEPSMTDLLGAVAEKSAKPVFRQPELMSVSTSSGLSSALTMEQIKFIVLQPGSYHCSPVVPFMVGHDVTIVGLGQVTFLKDYMHVFAVCGARLHLSNVRVTDGGKYELGFAAFSVDRSTGWLTLCNCIIEDTREVGIIAAAEGRCTIEDCQFRQMGRQAVEVREMGQVEIRRSNFTGVWQGVLAYAGARSVVIEEVVIEGSTKEGVMASGDLQTAETQKMETARGPKQDAGAPGWQQRVKAKCMGKVASMRAKAVAEDMDWNGRLVLAMSDCSIKHASGLACSIDDGCAAALTRCSFEATALGMLDTLPGAGVLVKGGSDATIRNCRFLRNTTGLQVGYNYSGYVLLEGSIFSGNLVADVLDETSPEAMNMITKKGNHIPIPKDVLDKISAERQLHEQAGAWSSREGVQQSGNKFLSKSDRVPEIHELSGAQVQGKQPLPQKLAWEAAARGNYDLDTPCPCGFSCTELGNSAECSQLGSGNHIDFPPFMCLPFSEGLSAKQDDPNQQFYFQTDRVPTRHWCLLGQVMSVDLPRTADAHSFMAANAVEAAKSIKLRTKFADQSAEVSDVEVLLLSDEPFADGSSKIEPGSTLAILYAEANEIDITRGTGQVFVNRNSFVYSFGAPLAQVLASNWSLDSAICGGCGQEPLPSSKSCPGCRVLQYCSEKCFQSDRKHELLCPQMAMLKRLTSADFRSFASHFSFVDWAEELRLPKESAETMPTLAPSEVSPTGDEVPTVPTTLPSEKALPVAEDLCSLLDSVVDSDLAEIVRRVEDALQEKDADGSLAITKSTGRNKLQNKLKRARGRLTKVESKEPAEPAEPEPAPVAEVEEAVEYEEHPAAPVERSKTGLGSLDDDGYHGVYELPWWAKLSVSARHKCKKACHLFLSYPKRLESPSEMWCTNINPNAFCCDFAEVVCQPQQPRILSCWGHSETRPGKRIPNMAVGTRLWKIRPSEITFSQDSIGKRFTDGNSLDATLQQLVSGECKIDEIEKIKITWHSHPEKSPGKARWWTYTGNRRLSLFQTLEDKGHLQFIVAEWVNVPVPEWRMTTKRPGDRPLVRR